MSVPELTTIATAVLRDSRLSYAARGLFAYMASCRDGDPAPSGDISRLVTELEDAGYITLDTDSNIVITDTPDGVL